MNTIAAEHFPLTPAIRSHVENHLAKLGELLPESASIHVFLSEPVHKSFRALCKVRVWGKDLVVASEDENLYKAVEVAGDKLSRRIIDEKHHWVRLRRSNSRPLTGNQNPASA